MSTRLQLLQPKLVSNGVAKDAGVTGKKSGFRVPVSFTVDATRQTKTS
jgi:hypothetical protein